MSELSPEAITASKTLVAESRAVLDAVVEELCSKIGVKKDELMDMLKTVDDGIWLDMMAFILQRAPKSFTEWEYEFYNDLLDRDYTHLTFRQRGVFWKTFFKLFRTPKAAKQQKKARP